MTPSSTEIDDIEFLRRNIGPWEVIEVKWERTSKIRLHDMKAEQSLEKVTSKFPLLTNLRYNRVLVSIFYLFLICFIFYLFMYSHDFYRWKWILNVCSPINYIIATFS